MAGTIRVIKEVTMAASDTATPWYALNSKFGDNQFRGYSGLLVSGDTITIQLTNDEAPNTTTETYVASNAHSTTPFGGAWAGGWRWIRAVKTGTNGAAKIKFEL